MGSQDHLRALLDGISCTVCEERVPPEHVRLLARRDDLLFLESACGACGSTALGFVATDAIPSEADRLARGEPMSADDVLDMHELLDSWTGDLASLVDWPVARQGPARPSRAPPNLAARMTDAAGGETTASASMPATSGAGASANLGPQFAHGSEAEMARILDFYGVRWEYEPRTFPILWNLEGDVVESFSPDFYLPDLELFLEMTTLRQRLVRKKNRKLRRLRELYPDIRIKLFYARDFRAMLLKYGRLALADSLSGTLGQVMPDRPPEAGWCPVVAEGVPRRLHAASRRSAGEAGSAARRSASRSRRRRTAAAARSAARAADAASSTTAAGPPEEERGAR